VNTEPKKPAEPESRDIAALFDEALWLVDTLDPDEMTSVAPEEDELDLLPDALEYSDQAVLAFGPDPSDDARPLPAEADVSDPAWRPERADPDVVDTEKPAPTRQVGPPPQAGLPFPEDLEDPPTADIPSVLASHGADTPSGGRRGWYIVMTVVFAAVGVGALAWLIVLASGALGG